MRYQPFPRRSERNGLVVQFPGETDRSCIQGTCPVGSEPGPGPDPEPPPINPDALTPDGNLLIGTGIDPAYGTFAEYEANQVFLVPHEASSAGVYPEQTSPGQYVYDGDGDLAISFGVVGEAPLAEATLTYQYGDQTRELVMQEAPDTPQGYNWVDPDDEEYVVEDSATNEGLTTSQNTTRASFLFDDVPTPPTGAHVVTLTYAGATTSVTVEVG